MEQAIRKETLEQKERKVKILSDVVVNQIAAGEVVERPASVVKELVENSLDAEADEITVVVDNGGRSTIEVIDNGIGMEREDALCAVERFGTSKIQESEDLQRIATLGFRGEALPSIASVSKFVLESKARSSTAPDGVVVEITGGKLQNVSSRPLSAGTKMQVKNLFFNVPARRQFLKTEQTEANIVKSLVCDFALAYPSVRFKLIQDGRETLSFSPVETLKQRASQLEVAGKKPVYDANARLTSRGSYEIEFLLSEPLESVQGAAKCRFLINGRIVRDKLLLSAVRQAYGNYLKAGRYPQGIVKLTVPPQDVDVNVHPQKAEVRFRDSSAVFSFVASSIKKALENIAVPAHEVIHGAMPEERGLAEQPENYGFAFKSSVAQERLGESHIEFIAGAVREKTEVLEPTLKLTSLRYLGQFFKCFLLFEGNEKLYIFDMHACHERVRFYKLKKQMSLKSVAKQGLLVPETISIPFEHKEKAAELRDVLSELGFEIEPFGENALVIRTVPSVFGSSSASKMFLDLFSLPEWEDWQGQLQDKIDYAISRVACHSSIRAGRELEREEVYALLEELEEAESSGLCPHGRPVYKAFSRYEIECMFGRVV